MAARERCGTHEFGDEIQKTDLVTPRFSISFTRWMYTSRFRVPAIGRRLQFLADAACAILARLVTSSEIQGSRPAASQGLTQVSDRQRK